MGKNRLINSFDKAKFAEKWEACRLWFEGGPDSYLNKYYIRRWGDEPSDPVEQIQITPVSDDIYVAIECAWESAIAKTRGKVTEETVRLLSETLHYDIPFRNRVNADSYAAFGRDSEELRDKYMKSFNPVRTLKSVFETNEANCVAHSLAIKEIITDKRFQIFNNYYEFTDNPDFFGKIGVHTILAKLEYGTIYAIDSSEGPVAHKDKFNPFMYKMTIEHFAKNYVPSCIRSSFCEGNRSNDLCSSK